MLARILPYFVCILNDLSYCTYTFCPQLKRGDRMTLAHVYIYIRLQIFKSHILTVSMLWYIRRASIF